MDSDGRPAAASAELYGSSLHHDGSGRPGLSARVVEAPLDGALWGRVEALAAAQDLAPFAIAWTAFGLLLERLAEGPVALSAELPQPVRVRVASAGAASFVEAVREQMRGLANPADTPPTQAPVYGFALAAGEDGVCAGQAEPPPEALVLILRPGADGRPGSMRVVADAAAFSAARLEGLLAGYRHLLDAALASPDSASDHLPLAGAYDRAASLPVRDDRPLGAIEGHEGDMGALFTSIARRWPSDTAMVWPGGAMSFQDLDQQAAALAELLSAQGAASGDAIALRQTGEATHNDLALFLIAQVAALRLGCALAPLGQQMSSPLARAQIAAIGPGFLLSTTAQTDCTPPGLAPGESLDGPIGATSTRLTEARSGAYPGVGLLLTSSGTTGAAKTIQISQAMLIGLLRGLASTGVMAPGPYLMGGNIGFDVLVVDVWMSWIFGRPVVLQPTERRTAAVIAEAQAMGARSLSISPTIAAAALDDDPEAFSGLDFLHLMGEALPPNLVDRVLRAAPGLRVVNGYGPSETGVLTNVWPVQPTTEASVPIGPAIPGYRVLVGDGAGRPLPAHWPGELLIASAAPAPGYLDPQLTVSRFVELPGEAPGPFFRSGDYGWIDDTGQVRFIGRRDRQVKAAGVRIELDGVEYRIAEVEGVAQVAVVVTGGPDASQIVAVVQPRLGAVDEEALRTRVLEHCRATLMRAAVPSDVILVSGIPTGPSGKKSHSAIRAMLAQRRMPAAGGPEALAGVSDETRRVALRLSEMWGELLRARGGTQTVGPDGNVAMLGATSLDMMRMAERVEREFAIRMPDAQFLLYPTILAQAELVAARQRQGGETPGGGGARRQAVRTLIRPAAPGRRSRGAIVGLPDVEGSIAYLGEIAAHGLEDYEVWAFSFDCGGAWMIDSDDWFDCARSITEQLLADDHFRPAGLIGFSSGGFLAWLVDRLLVAAGRPATPVINLDGEPMLKDRADWRARVAPLLSGANAAAPRMLLVHRAWSPRRVRHEWLEDRWADQMDDLALFALATTDHMDMVRAAGVAAYREVVEAFLSGQEAASLPPASRMVESVGGGVFALLAAASPPDPEAVRLLFEELVYGPPRDPDGLGLLLTPLTFLALACGELYLALAIVDRRLPLDPAYRAATYVKIAVRAATGRMAEASHALAEWTADHGADEGLSARAGVASDMDMSWDRLVDVTVDWDHALDGALALGLRRLAERNIAPGAPPWTRRAP